MEVRMSSKDARKGEQNIQDPDRRAALSKGLKALAAIGITGVAIGLSGREALAGSCKNCGGTTTTCSGTPTCGVQ